MAKKGEPIAGTPQKKKVSDANSGLKLLYQPIFDPVKDRICGFEGLLRIYDTELGVLTPGMFLDIAQKDLKLIRRLENWSVEEIIKSSKKMSDKDLDVMSVNISSKHFYDPGFINDMAKVTQRAGSVPDNIYFELKEEVLFSLESELKEKVLSLRELGIKFAIDDFGLNFFVSQYKPMIPIDLVKIDMSVTKNFLTNRNSKNLIKTIMTYARQNKIDVIAVGVESKMQEDALGKMGIRKMQGFLYSKPMQTQRMVIKKKD